MGQDKWGPVAVAKLAAQVTSRNFKEHDLDLAILAQSPVAEAKLLRKFKAIRFFDDDIDSELRGCYRIRSDRLT
jgi:hypothetical protein